MKLHLPKLLRNSVLACITAVAGIATTTVGTATFTGGVVAFALAAAPQALADYTWIGGTGTATPKTQADWDTASNWNLGGASFNDSGKGPGTPNSNLWELIKINGGTEGVQIGSEDARIGLEGWKPRLHLDSKASLYANINKFQDTSTFTVINDSMLNLTHTGGQFRAATFNVGAGSSIVLNLTTSFGNEMQTINLNAPDATMTIAHTGDLDTLTGPVTVNASLADIDEGTLGVQNVGLILDNVAISGALTFNFGSEWTLSETEITEANKAENEGKYYVYAEAGVYKVVYSQRSGPAWHGGALSWGADTVFSNGYSYTAGCDVAFSKADAAVTVVADVSAGRVKVKDGIKVSIGGEHTLTAETVSIGENAQLSILKGSAVSLGAVSMKDGGQLNIATGGETTVQDVLGSATWTGGAIGVTNGTTVSLSDTVLNTSNIVVDGSGSVLKVSNAGNATGKVYLEGDVTLKNGAVMEFVEGAGNDGLNYSNANRIEILSNSELRTNNNRLSLQGVDEIILNNGKVKGTGDDHGVLDFIEDGAVVVSSGTSSIEGSIRLRTSGATTTFQVESGTLTISDFKNSQGNLAKTGAGTMIITGATNYPGTTTVNGGELILQATGNTGKGAITLGAGGTLTIAESANQAIGSTISGTGTLNLNGTLTIDLASYTTLAASGGAYSDGENGYAEGLLVATVGTVNKGANGSVVVIDGETTNTYTSADINVSGGNMYVGSSDGTYFINTDVTYDAAKLGEVTGFCLTSGAAFRTADASVLSKTTSTDSTGTVYLSSPGSVIETAASASTYKGNVVITSGTEVKVMHKQALGVEYSNNATQTVTVEDGAVLDVNGTGDVYYSVVLEQGATLANKSTNGVGTGNKQNPRVTLNGDATIDAQGEFGIVCAGYGTSYLTLNGHTLTKTGADVFNLWNTAVTAGTIDIQGGHLRFGIDTVGLNEVDLMMQAGTKMSYGSNGDTARDKNVKSLTIYQGSSTGDVELEQSNSNVSINITGSTSAAAKINKTGAGSLTLSGTNTLGGGLTVSAGTLTLNGATTLGGTITIESGATLALGENVTVTLSSLAGFAGSSAAIPTTNGLVTGSTYKIVDNKNADNANNGLTSVQYNGETCTLGADGTISAGAKIYYAVEAGDGKVVTVGGSSPTADTANATEFYVGENGTLKIAGNASDSLTADRVLATTTGDGTIVLASTVGVATGTSIQFAGKLSIATGGALNFNPGKGAAADMSNVTAVEFDGGTVNYNAAPDVWNSVSVTTNGGTMNIQDHPDSNTTPIQFTGVTSLAGDLTINTSWKSYLNIEQLTGAGDLILSSTGGNTDGLGANTTVGVKNGFTGNIDIRGKADNKEHVTVVVGSGCSLAASRIIINDAAGVDVKLSGSGTYTNGDSLALAGGISLAEGWKGTVAVSGANVTGTVDTSALTNSSSTLAISGLTVADGAALTLGGNVSLGGTVSVAESIAANGTLTFGSDLKLSVAEDMITNGTGNGEKVITLITGAGASAVGSMSSAMLSDELLALGVADSWAFNADGTISFTSVNVNPKLVWGGGDGSLSDSSKYANGATYEAGSDITFGAVTDGNADTITVAASDSIANATVQTGGNYVFTGSKLNVTGNLSIATGAAVDAQAGLSVGGSLESAGTLKATTIDGAGNVSITGGSLELSGSLANTGTKSISGAELKGSWSATGVSLGTGVTVGEGGTITLTDTTLAGTVTNKGNLTLSGTVNITPSANFQTQVSGVQYSDGANGIKYADVTYTITTGTGTITATDATWKVDGVAKGTYTDGKLNVRGAQQGTLYWANSGDVTYTGNMTGATGIALNGGNVALNASLADSMTDGIQVSKAGTVTLGSDATLAATQVNGATAANKVTLDGTGTYDLGSDTALGAGIGLADSWKGTVQVDATSVTAGADLSALGNASSTIGIDGALTLGTAETAATLNAGSSALALESLTMGNVASSITAGSLVLGDSFALNLTDVLKASQEIAGNTLITLTTALSDEDKSKLTGTWKGTGVAGLYDYETSWNGNALVLTGKQNAIIWEGETESGEGGDESGFGGSEQTWNSETTDSDKNVAFTGNCAGGDGVVNVAGDATGAVEVGSVTVTDIESEGISYTFKGDSINAAGDLVVGTVDEEEVETKGELTISNNSTFKGSATVTESSSLAVSGVTTTDDDGNSTTTEASLTVGSLSAAGSVTVGDSGSLTVTGDLTIEDASEEEGTKGGSLSISTAGSLAAGVTTTTDAEGNTTQAATGKLSVDKITITGTLQDNAATLVTVGNLEKDVVIDLEDDSTLKDIKAGTFNLMSVLGTVTEVTLDADDLQAILAKGLGCNGLSSTGGATTFSLRRTLAPVPTDIYLEVRELTADELIWDTNEGSSTGGLNIVDKVNDDGSIVLKDNSILDTIQTVDVVEDITIDLSSTDDTDTVNINGLTGEKNLSIVGNADDVKVSTADGGYKGTLSLDKVDASVSGKADSVVAKGSTQVDLDVSGTGVVVDGKDVTLTGKMQGGDLSVSEGASLTDSNLEITGTDIGITKSNPKESTAMSVAGTGTQAIADLAGVSGSAGDITIGWYDAEKGEYVQSALYAKYFDTDSFKLVGGKIMADRNTSYYTDKAGEGVSANGAAGLAMADAVLVELNPQAAKVKGGLAAVLDALDTATGAAADELGASLAGASTAVLGMAVSGDVDRQLQAIRNRTTTMGVDQSVVNEEMPYFNAWINAEGDRSELSESGTESGYELSSWGGTVGFDVDLCPTFTAGMALTAMYGDIDTTGADKASGNIDTYYVTAFARYAPSAWTHTFVATVGMSDISLDRHVAGAEVEGETDGLSFGLMYEVGRVFALDEDGSTCLQPVFNVTWKHTAIDAYTEDGSDLALEVDEQTLDTVTFGLGARLQTVVGESMYNRTSILEARVLAKADVGDRSGSADVALSALPGAKASVDSAEMGAFGLEAGAGLTIPVGDEGGSIFMDASVELRSDYTNVNGTVGYRINF